jgi:capsular exopolysaccharide synthesis family protein
MNVDQSDRASLDLRTARNLRSNGSIAPEVHRETVWPETDELFRGIYTRAGLGFTPEVVAVTSATPGEGKTMLSLALAVSLAQDFPDRKVMLVETDVHQPALASDFGIEPSPGLVDCLIGDEPLDQVCRPTYLDNLDVIPAGLPIARAGRPLRSARMAALMDVLRQSYHFIIVDTPALLTNSDTLLLTDFADGVLFVVRSGVTPAALVNKALEQVDETKLRGVVLNGVQSSTPRWLRRLMGN